MLQRLLIFILILSCNFIQAQDSKDTIGLKDLISMDIEQILNMKVSIATKSEQNFEQATAVVTVITQEEIQNLGARDLSDVLLMVPGFDVTKTTSGQNKMEIRGVKDPRAPCKVLVLLDGQPANAIFYGDMDADGYKFDLNNLDRIEIIRGPGSPLYGRNAFSAVINLISKTGKADNGLTVRSAMGNFNTYKGWISYGLNNKDIDFHISSFLIKSDGSDAKYPEGSSYQAGRKWSASHNNQIFNARFKYKNLQLSGSFGNEDLGSWESAGEVKRIGGNYLLEYTKNFKEKYNLKFRLYGINRNHLEDIQIVPPDTSSGFLGFYVTPKFKEYLYGAEVETNISISDKNDLLMGLQGDFHGVKDVVITSNFNLATGAPYPGVDHDNQILYEPGWFVNNGHDYQNIAFYLQDIYHPIKQVSITLGARYDIDSQIGGVFNPRMGIVWNFVPQANLKILYGEAYRAPAPTQQYQTAGYAMGNPDLKPEKLKSFEVSLSYHFKNMITQVNTFYNRIKDLIYAETYVTADVTNTAPHRNMGKNISKGIEFENKLFISKTLSLFLNYSYTISENTDILQDSTERIYNHPDVAPHKLNAGLTFVLWKYFNLSTTVMYRSKMEKYMSYNIDTKTFTEVSRDPVGNYAILNGKIRFFGLVKNLEISGSVYNMFNTNYYSQEPTVAHVPVQGKRQFIIRIGYKF